MKVSRFVTRFGLVLSIALSFSSAQERVTSPKEHFGFNLGDDYVLVNYTQLLSYWQKIDRESGRLALSRIGTTAEGRPMVMAVITSSGNQRKLGRYREISRRLALADGLTESDARALAQEGKAADPR
jgi:hypothetical protein